jgi:chromosome segregation ATPase
MNDSEKLDLILSKLESHDTKFNSIEHRLDNIEHRLETHDTKLDNIEHRLGTHDTKFNDIKLHLENVTDNNIKIVAEGHLDLNRKLDEALKVETEKELLLIRMNYLESELEEVKKRLSQIA